MKHCPACFELFDDEVLVCPEDSNLLDAATKQEVGAALEGPAFASQDGVTEPAAPRHVDTGSLVDAALGALEGHRTRERDAVVARMHRLERYNTYCHALWRFVYDLTDHSDHFAYTVRNMNEEARMWVSSTLSIGEGRHLRRFPIRVTYDRELGHDVTLEIDLEEIGATRDERIERTEAAGGRAAASRFGWSYVIAAPRSLEDEESVLAWLRRTFWVVFRLAYGVE
jgi:hypothetical protein